MISNLVEEPFRLEVAPRVFVGGVIWDVLR
jgi:hypothetical protein